MEIEKEGESWKHGLRGLLTRIAFALLGFVTAFLILWTPYAWTKLAIAGQRWMILLFAAYWPVRVVLSRYGAVSPHRRIRQLVAVVGFSALAVFYCVIPWIGVSGLDHTGAALPAWGIPIAGFLGAYAACLWVGWYFYLQLQRTGTIDQFHAQWYAHGSCERQSRKCDSRLRCDRKRHCPLSLWNRPRIANHRRRSKTPATACRRPSTSRL